MATRDASLLEPETRRTRDPRDASLLDRRCAWCGGEIPRRARRDSKFCRVGCRQASHRFGVRRADQVATARPMRVAYADPPYPGRAHYYAERQEVDHAELVERLVRDYPDGWALSTSAVALAGVLRLCPLDVRVCSWHRSVRRTRSSKALSGWEPLIVAGGRPLRVDVVQDLTDALVARGRHRAYPGALIGMKPPAFATWMFGQLGAGPGDVLDDLFPGSGAIGRAWSRYAGPGDGSCLSRGDASPPAAADAYPSAAVDGYESERVAW